LSTAEGKFFLSGNLGRFAAQCEVAPLELYVTGRVDGIFQRMNDPLPWFKSGLILQILGHEYSFALQA